LAPGSPRSDAIDPGLLLFCRALGDNHAMRAFIWFFRLVLFLLFFGFAVKNDEAVSLLFFFGGEWHLPLVFIILISFTGGALLGVTASMTSLLRQRRELAKLRKQLERAAPHHEQQTPVEASL
jgi:uncharacterized integral membrane protein